MSRLLYRLRLRRLCDLAEGQKVPLCALGAFAGGLPLRLRFLCDLCENCGSQRPQRSQPLNESHRIDYEPEIT